MRRRKIIRLATYLVAMVLAVVFVVRGIIIPIANRISGKDESKSVEVQANISTDPDAAIRQPLKGQQDAAKVAYVAPGWHEDENGKWYQNADGTYYAGGFQDISGTKYCFNDNGYVQTGWVSKGIKDYYFNEDGSYDPTQKRKLLCLTFDDGPSSATTPRLLDILYEKDVPATFFVLGKMVREAPDIVKRAEREGHIVASHTMYHQNLVRISTQAIKNDIVESTVVFSDILGHAPVLTRPPYGNINNTVRDSVGTPMILWSVDTLDWQNKDPSAILAVTKEQIHDGAIILMHDIYDTTVDAVPIVIDELRKEGYDFVTVPELAEIRGISLQSGTAYYNFRP